MKRIGEGKPVCFTISSSELKHGWSVQGQLKKNPEAKREFPELRRQEAAEAYIKRSYKWVSRGRKNKDPEDFKRAAFAMEKARKLGAAGGVS